MKVKAIKDKVSFYKSIMVKVIGQSKKMTEESYDYSSQYYYGSGSFEAAPMYYGNGSQWIRFKN